MIPPPKMVPTMGPRGVFVARSYLVLRRSVNTLCDFQEHFAAALNMPKCLFPPGKSIGCGDRHMQLPLSDQPDARFDGFLELGRIANRWMVDPQASNGHIAKDGVYRAEKIGFARYRRVHH